jgi:hypothetical protein
MTNAFRYVILMAKDYLEPLMIESKHGMVDDNFFH